MNLRKRWGVCTSGGLCWAPHPYWAVACCQGQLWRWMQQGQQWSESWMKIWQSTQNTLRHDGQLNTWGHRQDMCLKEERPSISKNALNTLPPSLLLGGYMNIPTLLSFSSPWQAWQYLQKQSGSFRSLSLVVVDNISLLSPAIRTKTDHYKSHDCM